MESIKTTIIEWYDPKKVIPLPDIESFYKEDGNFSRKVMVCLVDGEISFSRTKLVDSHPKYGYRDGRTWLVWTVSNFSEVVMWAEIPNIKLQ